MSDINLILANFESSKNSNESISFNKKNAWKNEWEKAQLDNRSSSTPHHSDNSKQKSAVNYSENTGFYSNSFNVNFAASEKQVAIADNDKILPSRSIYISNKISVSSPVISSSETITSQSIQNVLTGNLSPNNIKITAQKTLYIRNVIEQVKVRFGSIFKPQNLNLITTGSGVKILLRDYRLDKNQLNSMIEDITGSLKELGINVAELIVNGEKTIILNNSTNKKNVAINITGEIS